MGEPVEINVHHLDSPSALVPEDEVEGGRRNVAVHSGPQCHGPSQNRLPRSQWARERHEVRSEHLFADAFSPANQLGLGEDHRFPPTCALSSKT